MSIFQNLIHEVKKLREIRLNRNIISYLVCVVIASILWLLNALNQEDYAAELTYPVKYVNFPEGKYPLTKLPSQIQLEVKAKGFSLLGYKIKTSFLPITLNVSTYSTHLKQKGDVFEYVLNTNDIKDKISSQLSPDMKLLNVYPDEIVFKFATARHKKVAIRPSLDYTLKRQYILNRMTTVPDSIWISGPAPVIDTLQYVSTQTLHLENINKNMSRKVDLAKVPGCTFKEESVDLLIEVEQFTEAKKTIKITTLHAPDSMNIRLFPPNVNISYEIGLSKYDKVSDNDFIFSVDYPQNANQNFLAVKVQKSPAFIKNLSYSPQKVEYILEKK